MIDWQFGIEIQIVIGAFNRLVIRMPVFARGAMTMAVRMWTVASTGKVNVSPCWMIVRFPVLMCVGAAHCSLIGEQYRNEQQTHDSTKHKRKILHS